MKKEYDFSKGVRGKYANRYKTRCRHVYGDIKSCNDPKEDDHRVCEKCGKVKFI